MPALETNSLTKNFKDFRAVDSLNLMVPEGSVYGFLGPNGAGKTTTLKMLTGLSKPDSGKVKIFGMEVNFGSTKNRDRMGYLPDVPTFYDWMNAAEFLKFSGELFGIDRSTLKSRIGSLLELVGLSGVDKKTGGYSRGMKQRLGIAQALINDPGIVLLDEPTSALDPIGRKEVLDIIQQLAGRTTVFFSTHILADIERVCDRVVILNHGRKVLENELETLRQSHAMNCILIEIDRDSAGFIDKLGGLDWIDKISAGNNGDIKVFVKDIHQAQVLLPEIISRNGFALKKFSIVESTLEEIFLEAVKK